MAKKVDKKITVVREHSMHVPISNKNPGRSVSAEEIILEYKGLLKSKSLFRETAIKKFRREYGKLKGN